MHLFLLFLAACDPGKGDIGRDSGSGTVPLVSDGDGDGFVEGDDCDDADPAVNPSATETCNGVDDDCDGDTDGAGADGASTWYVDADGDGYGDALDGADACEAPYGYVADATDCDDADAAANPGATEVCDDADRDEDCDGSADDADDDAAGLLTWTRDVDEDGYGAGLETEACDRPEGYAAEDGDCDDLDPDRSPADPELCDDADLDEDCDGVADDADDSTDPGSWSTWRRDADGDGYGDDGRTAELCDAPEGYVAEGGDCDDASAAVSPAATEVCGAGDEDCDGLVDADDPSVADLLTYYADMDADGYGDFGTSFVGCSVPADMSLDGTDCDDETSWINPGEAEVCDDYDIDENCDRVADDASATGQTTWYLDADGDGYGGTGAVEACEAPSGATAVADDCDDGDAAVNPGAAEVCDDGLDNDCDDSAGACELSDLSSVATADTILSTGGYFGMALGWGDLDGDGLSDLVVGAPEHAYDSYYSGYVYVFSGPLPAGTASADTAAIGQRWQNDSFYYGLGDQLWVLPDVTGDGMDELVWSEQGRDEQSVEFGAVTGTWGAYSRRDTFYSYTGPYAGAGHFNADTIGDFLVGDTDSGTGGVAYVYAGVSSSTPFVYTTFTAEASGDGVGSALAGGGDVDGDGSDDVWVGAEGQDAGGTASGAAYLVCGPISGTVALSGADARAAGESAGDHAGIGLFVAGDADGDGNDDVLVGAEGSDLGAADGGAVYLVTSIPSATFSLSTASAVIVGEDADDAIGASRRISAGDVNGDGAVDVLVSTHVNSDNGSNAGKSWLVYGPLSGTIDLATDGDASLVGETSVDWAGYVSGIIGDTDGDGFDDLAIGAPYSERVYVWTGGGI